MTTEVKFMKLFRRKNKTDEPQPEPTGCPYVRVQKGDSRSKYTFAKSEYVRWVKDGQWLDIHGNPSIDPNKTHFPFDDFKYI